MTLDERAQAITTAAEALGDAAATLGRTSCLETGKPLPVAIGEVKQAAAATAAMATSAAEALRSVSSRQGDLVARTVYDPYGVCAVLAPWNFPVWLAHCMVVPALCAGNTVVLKPSENTPLVGDAYARTLAASLPPGVLTSVVGGPGVGEALVAARVQLVAFTGSRATGKSILRSASERLTRVIMELGGKDVLIVLDDADLAAAADFACRSAFFNSGQVCVSSERMLVDARVEAKFVELLRERAQRLRMGHGLTEGVDLGPLIHQGQFDRVAAHVTDACERGAEVVLGGPRQAEGLFFPPTILRGVTPGMKIFHEETFGPVANIITVHGEDDAVAKANEGDYGLSAVVFGGDRSRAERVARRLDVGMIGINRPVTGARDTPWVGAKQSGYGFHGSPAGHRHFAQVRVLLADAPLA